MENSVFVATMLGRVKHWSKKPDGSAGTYGFIEPQDVKYGDVFVHFSEIEPWRPGFKEPLEPDQIVKFDAYRDSKRKLTAKNVEIKREQKATLEDFQSAHSDFSNQRGF